ncbi:MAG TPA: DUF998 domain-containing protein [Candidatus Dormibacteraeota bacterium]
MVTRLALWAGVVGPPLFVATFLIEGLTRRGYDAVRLQVSYLSLGDQGWIQIANFCVCGVLAIFFAWGLKQALQSGRGSLLGPLLIAAYGLGLIVSGVFVTDAADGYPPGTAAGAARATTFHGLLHVIPGTPLTFGSPILASIVFAWRFWGDRTTRRWAVYSLSTPLLVVVAQILLPESAMGLSQRIALILLEVWLVAIAAHFLAATHGSRQALSG